MSLLNVLQFPDPRLKRVAAPIENIDDDIKQLATDLLETLYATSGVGLAATQVNVHKRILVCDTSHDGQSPRVIINPEIIRQEGSMQWEEACLSFPEVSAKIKRARTIEVQYTDLEGSRQTLLAEGDLLSACLQHEIDHLNGITFFDRLSKLKQTLLFKKIRKLQEAAP